MKLEHGFFAMNMPKHTHTRNMANLCHYSTHRAWGCVDTKVPPNHRININMELFSILEYPLSAFAGVVARVELLRGRMGESARGVEGLFESLLSESFG